MCMFIDTEVVLANLLQADHQDNGVDYKDLEQYCKKLKEKLFQLPDEDIHCVSFQIDKRSLEDVVDTYPFFFKKRGKKYYKGMDFDLSKLDRRTNSSIRTTMSDVALSM